MYRSMQISVALAALVALAAACGTKTPAPDTAPAAGEPGPASAGESDPAGAHAHGDHAGAHGHGDPAGHGHGDPAGPAGHAAHGHGDHAGGDEHQILGHRFERAEDWVKQFDDPGRAEWQKPAAVLARMAIEPGMTVADIGAGTGYFTPHLSRAVGPDGAVLALDAEADMVRHLTERAAREKLANVTARHVKPGDPTLAAQSVDRILIVNTWHHIPAREAYAARLAAALRPGGAIYVVDYKLDSPRGPPRSHRLAPDVVTAELASAGLDVTLEPDTLPYQYIAIARK